jgi:hypothetical protein
LKRIENSGLLILCKQSDLNKSDERLIELQSESKL